MMSNFVTERTPRARREHWCALCLEKIERGRQYRATVCESDGFIYTWHEHLGCGALFEKLKPDYWGDDEGGYGLLLTAMEEQDHAWRWDAETETWIETEEPNPALIEWQKRFHSYP